MHPPPGSAGVENEDVVHDKMKVEQPIKKTRRRRGEAAAERQAAQAAAGNVPKRVRTNPGVVIKTKFPVARIKRIMQADEDVGKVAQVTPVIVCKLRTIHQSFSYLCKILRNMEPIQCLFYLSLWNFRSKPLWFLSHENQILV